MNTLKATNKATGETVNVVYAATKKGDMKFHISVTDERGEHMLPISDKKFNKEYTITTNN